MSVSKNALSVLEKRYLRKDAAGNVVETPEQMFRRVAQVVAAPDAIYGASPIEVKRTEDEFFALMWDGDFMPNSPTLANAGLDLGQLSACFVLGVPDDLAGIFETIKNTALIHQTGGGTGFAFSRLRPKNDRVQSTKGVSSGPVSFMDVFNAATEVIKQGGMRRGANMGILRIDHPDIMDFVNHKEDLSKLTNFNISVAITDEFMAAVKARTKYKLYNPRNGEAAGELDAYEVFKTIVVRAWSTGEPGLVFMDRMNRYCPVPWMGQYEATNPCGEQPLIENESCNLGSINLERFVVVEEPVLSPNGNVVPGRSWFDWERFAEVVHKTTHLLDNVIDANKYPLEQIERVTKATRKIGLGVMGFARALFKLGIAYGSDAAMEFAGHVMSYMDFHSKVKSVELAKSRGQFPARDGHEAESNAIYRKWCEERDAHPHRHPAVDYRFVAMLIEDHGIRNSTTTTVAPTGTISIIADTSGGCEPVFALAFKRWQADTHMVDYDDVFRAALVRLGLTDLEAATVIDVVERHKGSLVHALGAFNETVRPELELLAGVFVTSHDITPLDHVRVQAAFQAFNDSATSKTINFPKEATIEQVEEAYMLAWDTGCKGITVYRDESRQFQPLSTPSTPALPAHQAAATCCDHPQIVKTEGCEECKNCGSSACSYVPQAAPVEAPKPNT